MSQLPILDLAAVARGQIEKEEAQKKVNESLISRLDEALALARSVETHVLAHLPVVHPTPPPDASLPAIASLVPRLDTIESTLGRLAPQIARLEAIEALVGKVLSALATK
jgi:hypothetical protein